MFFLLETKTIIFPVPILLILFSYTDECKSKIILHLSVIYCACACLSRSQHGKDTCNKQYFSTKVSLSHSLSCSLSLAPSPLSYLSSSSDVIANSTLTSAIGFPAALVVWLPTAAWLIVHIGHHCPIP